MAANSPKNTEIHGSCVSVWPQLVLKQLNLQKQNTSFFFLVLWKALVKQDA